MPIANVLSIIKLQKKILIAIIIIIDTTCNWFMVPNWSLNTNDSLLHKNWKNS